MSKYILFVSFLASCFFQSKTVCSEFFLHIKNDPLRRVVLSECEEVDSPTTEKIYGSTLLAPSGIQVPITFYDRKSDVLLIAGQGLPGAKEDMEIFANLFDSYDVLLFDYRWSNHYGMFLLKSLLSHPVEKILLDEVEEIYTVLTFGQNMKNYKKIVGLGECYSSFLFTKIQADNIKAHGSGPFTHLILDSCWYSLRLFAKQICADPLLPLNPLTGGAPSFIKKISNNKIVRKISLKIIFSLIKNISIESYLPFINIPVLFIHGKNDLLIPKKHLKKIIDLTNPELRVILQTPYYHCSNVKNKKIYRFISEQFINGCLLS